MTLFPEIATLDDYRGVYQRDDVWLPALRQICARHGLPGAELRRAGLGSNIVFFAGDRVIKLFAPLWREDHDAERFGLTAVAGGLAVATPEIDAEGEIDGWPYLVVSRLPGALAVDLWPDLDLAARRSVCAEAGELAAALHAITVESEPGDWTTFIARQHENVATKHRRDGLDERWIADIVAFVGSSAPPSSTQVLIHGDLHADHFMIEHGRITGLIDFGDTMVGAPEHDFAASACFLAADAPGGTTEFLRAYGEPPLDPPRAHLLTTHVLLQRYCSLPQVLARIAPPHRPTNLTSLHQHLWR